jgi:3-hydroxyacyl-CoA dehydrogenase
MTVKISIDSSVSYQMPAPNYAVLSSNTSMLPISQFGSDVRRKDRLIIAHWFNPPHIVPVVEVVSAHETSEETFRYTVHLREGDGTKRWLSFGRSLC